MLAFSAKPIEKYSSLHTIALLKLLGFKTSLPPNLTIGFNFNLGSPFPSIAKAQLIFHLRDNNPSSVENSDFSINNLTRWRLDISNFNSFTDYVQHLKSNHKKNYHVTQKAFTEYGANLTLIDNDWSEYADRVYQLYFNVAKKNGSQLYDLNFFRSIAKLNEYKLICVWYQHHLISVLVIFDEAPIYHSMLCGFDYEHSRKIHAYSLMHYELIRLAIVANKYMVVDAGITADKAKSMMNFQPITACMDIYARNRLIKVILNLLSRFITATINEQAKLQFKFHFYQRN